MNRTLEHTTMIIIALLLSIVFTGQHYSHAEVLLRIKVDIVYSIQSDIYRERYIEPIETELLTQLHVERELDALDYVEVLEETDMFELTIFVTEHATPLFECLSENAHKLTSIRAMKIRAGVSDRSDS